MPSTNQISAALSAAVQQQQPWTRVYLYTGSNDSSPHKPIGDLLNRANFLMPDKSATTLPIQSPSGSGSITDNQQQQQQQLPMAKLVIEDPRLSDEALYKCDVTYVKGKCPSISLVRVQMMALPSKAQIVANQQLTLGAINGQSAGPIAEGQLIGPYNEHEQLKLACLVYGGRPQPKSVIWRKIDASGRTINLMQSSTINAATRQQQLLELNLNHTLTSADLGAKFECHVEHEAIEEPPARVVVSEQNLRISPASSSVSAAASADSLLDLHPSRSSNHLNLERNSLLQEQTTRSKSLDSHVYVDLNVGVASLDLFMAKVNRKNSSETLKEGDLVELECVAYNSKPPANITWFNGSDSIEQLDPTTAISASASPSSQSSALSTLSTLSVANNWHQQHKLRHKRLLQRNQIHQNNDGQTYNTHSFLSIKLSRHEHKSQILCKAQNGAMRQPMVKSLELQVEHAPIVLMEPASGLTVNESPSTSNEHQDHETSDVITSAAAAAASKSSSSSKLFVQNNPKEASVSIYCIYTANPTDLMPNSTRWFKDGQLLHLNQRAMFPHGSNTDLSMDTTTTSTTTTNSGLFEASSSEHRLIESMTPTGYPVLTIRQVNRRDAGSYECQLTNSAGSSERLPSSEQCRLEVNFRPTVQLKVYKPLVDQQQQPNSFSQDQLVELDLRQELVLAGSTLVLSCQVLEAQPSKIHKFHWFKRASFPGKQRLLLNRANGESSSTETTDGSQHQLMATSETGQFVLQSLAANFTPHSFACSAFNSLGSSELSNQLEIQLSYTPGPSFVRPIVEPTLRKAILASGKQTRTQQSVIDNTAESDPQPLPAGRELLLECVTPDLGQPRANIWLWFKNGHPIESSSPNPLNHRLLQQQQQPNSSNNPSSSTIEIETLVGAAASDSISNRDDNPITTGQQQELSAPNGPSSLSPSSSSFEANNNKRFNGLEPQEDTSTNRENQRSTLNHHSANVRLISSGRYLFIPSIQLAHKGNYSCVAVNRFGSSQKLQQQQQQQYQATTTNEVRDSYQVKVALAPSFVQPLASRSYWPEIPMESNQAVTNGRSQLELVCHVQCDPICQIEWLRNNEPLDLKRQTESMSSNYITYQVKQSILDENLEANLFKSIESKLIIQFLDNNQNGHQRFLGSSNSPLNREKVLERRNLLNGSNYTCQSSPNSMGPPVRSTTKFIVQYPPENVLINAPSDKLSLIEGSNGPSLSCEASGEPQVQYRWFLLKSSSSDLPTIAVNKYNQKIHGSISHSLSKAAASGSEQEGGSLDRPIDQVQQSKAFGGSSSSAGGVNDAIGIEQNLIELTGSATEQGGGAFSTLDLSNLSLDRKQTGRYICEASNRLGQTRQSVYVNVLYKPTCATLHLHSLDLTMLPKLDKSSKGVMGQESVNYRYKPYKATSNDEYSLARETSEDFIDLRKVLVLSPLLNKHTSLQNDDEEELSLRGSIFQSILQNDKNIQDSRSVIRDGKVVDQLKDTDALIHTDEKSDFKHNLLIAVEDNYKQSTQLDSSRLNNNSTVDSWDKFNILLLKFLNNYMKQVKTLEEKTIETAATKAIRDARVTRQNRRSSLGSGPDIVDIDSNLNSREEPLTNNESETNQSPGASRNLLTFACMAQDANPMSDLMFDWSFGSINLPETSETIQKIDSNNPTYTEQDSKSSSKPVLIHTNDNYTVQVMLVRRLDTRSSLNPFQMSLVTLNVIVEPSTTPSYSITNRIARQASGTFNRTAQASQRAPVVRHRYQQSLSNSLRGGQSGGSSINNNNLQFAEGLETKPFTLQASIELNERNWEEQIGNLLKCRVTNQIGTSDVCHVRVNIEERLKSQSSSSEFAKWRMPSLANKSLLIISIMIGCALIIFVTIALLLGPYLRELNIKKDESMRRRDNTNTGQSTCSQKSSVLGLLGNGDSSLQGSSDDDSSAKMNHIDNKGRPSNRMLDMDDMSISKAITNGYCRHNHLSQESSASYDEPRSLQDSRSIYSNRRLNEMKTNEMSSDLDNNYRYDGDLVGSSIATPAVQSTPDAKTVQGSAGSRLLANLKFKSLSKFKVDRISDLSSFANRMDQMRSVHNKNTSNAETNTTGLSISAMDGELPMKMTSPAFAESPTFFAGPSLRYSQSGVRRQATNNQQQQIYSLDSTQMYNQSSLQSEQDTRTMQLSSQQLMNAASSSILPAYSNMMDNDYVPNALDEFIRQREVDSSLEQNQVTPFYRSQSNRTRTADQALYMLKNDLNHFYPQPINRGPPVFPRTQQSSTMYQTRLDNRPAIIARSSGRHIMAANTASQPYPQISGRFSMPPYHQTSGMNEISIPNVGQMDTIDSHLNRLTENVVHGRHLNQNTAYANAIDSNSYTQDLYNNIHQNQSVEHIYDVNAYATPEQTPQRGPNSTGQALSSSNKRPRVSQLIQTFNSKAPEV